jgi:hypothetical protein
MWEFDLFVSFFVCLRWPIVYEWIEILLLFMDDFELFEDMSSIRAKLQKVQTKWLDFWNEKKEFSRTTSLFLKISFSKKEVFNFKMANWLLLLNHNKRANFKYKSFKITMKMELKELRNEQHVVFYVVVFVESNWSSFELLSFYTNFTNLSIS